MSFYYIFDVQNVSSPTSTFTAFLSEFTKKRIIKKTIIKSF